ncbi:Glycosyl hydrolase family 53 [Fusarium oxysporum f. sp. vasinfectum]|uniref:Arabinogalactan endo-beta-1,4-galactanase n=1 Tax=Fusarium oxysporum f. sp. vasinfectum 25433 TaxID=1089449 RepID=X0MJI9_FUSOX|nr:arabinogalactan endo-1,4-beta-galactosidase [Fusarium oxysporum f. sp. vasinfectum 25433]KAK2667302.1 Glycosyl hydrolase family 53 [Fusarium oxysporum f. sp. vasinfectum]KAK2931831.1 Glycosyl hydrolase family 53 [Fusarium oxysporum f. sp. vasinfectum]
MFKAIFLVALSTILPFSQLAAASICKASRASPLQYVGVDWSSAMVEERDNGVVYKDAQGVVKPLETILVEAGVNMVRQRVFTVDGDYGIDYNIKLARRASNAGLKFGLNLHFSDTWTNPDLQDIPTGWPTDIDGLERTLWNYVTEVANTFYSEGLWPETITIGNEIPNGILWPTGYFENPENLSRLLHTAAQAVRQSPLGSRTKILIHLAHGYNQELQNWFYDLVLAPGYLKLDDWDVSAVSFYPFWGEGATMQNLTDSLNHLATKYNKEVQVVETNWPTSCPNPDYAFPAGQLDIPFTPAGQAQYLRLLADTLKAIPAATGLNYWEPAWINNAVLGSSCEANVLFDPSGKAYDSLAALGTLL